MAILDRFRLDNKIALVTGANRGLGQAIALALAEAGASIIGLSSSNEAPETSSAIQKIGKNYRHISADLGAMNAETLHTLIREIEHLDILVNNAGIIRRRPALEHSENDWNEVLQINLKAVFFLAQAAAQNMAKQGSGKIINIASMLSYQGGINVPSYTASKHGVIGLTHALANEWANKGICVNAIAPGYMETDNTSTLRADEKRNTAILERIPVGRWGKPQDLQGAIVFLASAASDYLHGSIIDVDGGWMAR